MILLVYQRSPLLQKKHHRPSVANDEIKLMRTHQKIVAKYFVVLFTKTPPTSEFVYYEFELEYVPWNIC